MKRLLPFIACIVILPLIFWAASGETRAQSLTLKQSFKTDAKTLLLCIRECDSCILKCWTRDDLFLGGGILWDSISTVLQRMYLERVIKKDTRSVQIVNPAIDLSIMDGGYIIHSHDCLCATCANGNGNIICHLCHKPIKDDTFMVSADETSYFEHLTCPKP